MLQENWMAMSSSEKWIEELERPTEGFFPAFTAQIAEPEGVRDAVREAIKTLVPCIDWEAYLPHLPHGVLGLRAVLRLRPLLPEAEFLRALAAQLHMAAHEGRRSPALLAQVRSAKGSGLALNLVAYVQARRPALAFAEAQGVAEPSEADFQPLAKLAWLDMANVGHKAVACDQLADLQELLGQPKATGRRLLGLAAWLLATPEDSFWARRAAKRLGEAPVLVSQAAPTLSEVEQDALVRVICDEGLVGILDHLTARLEGGLGQGDALAVLVLSASEKLLDARRDLEGKTAWTLVYLATLARARPVDARVWCQAAALVNLFPTEEAEDRIRPTEVAAPSAEALLDAILDAEPEPAMGQAAGLLRHGQEELVLRTLARAAAANDPTFNHAHQVLVLAAAADLLPQLPPRPREAMLVALAKSLANSQGSGDIGRLAERALREQGQKM